MRTILDLPDDLLREVERRGLHEGPELNNAVANALRNWLDITASASDINSSAAKADEAMLHHRKELTQKFVSGEWGAELAGYEAAREADRQKSAERALAWRE